MIKHRLQRRRRSACRKPRRHPQQHRLIEPLNRTAALLQPMHDRRRRQPRRPRISAAATRRRGNRRAGRRRQRRHRLMLEHRPRREQQARPAAPGSPAGSNDAVAAKLEEIVVNADPLEPQHLRKQTRTASPPAACAANATPRPASPAQAAHGGRACRSPSAAADPEQQSQDGTRCPGRQSRKRLAKPPGHQAPPPAAATT